MIVIIKMMMIFKRVEKSMRENWKLRKEEKNERLKDEIREERIDIENESYLNRKKSIKNKW